MNLEKIGKLLLIFFILDLIFLGFALFKRFKAPVGKGHPATKLSLIAQKEQKIAQKFEVSLNLEPNGNKVIGTESYIKFNPKNLKLEEIEDGSLFAETPIKSSKIDNDKGLSTYIIALGPDGKPFDMGGQVATFIFTPLIEGETEISFDKKQTIVAAVGDEAGLNAIATYQTLKVVISK